MSDSKTFYDRYWENKHMKCNTFDGCPDWTPESFRYHFDFFKPFIGGRLLDFGCGEGKFLSFISEHCDSSCGVDICESVIEKAKKSYSGIKFLSLEHNGKLPFADGYFQTVCAMDVFEHILDLESVLEEVNRVMSIGGHLLIATSELTKIKTVLIALTSLDNYFYPASPHIRYFTRKNLEDILRKKGFELIGYKKNKTYLGFIPKGQMVVAKKNS